MIGLSSLCLIFISGLYAYRDKFLTVRQMIESGTDKGLPYIWHFGMYGDVFIITPLVAHIVSKYCDQWLWKDIGLSLLTGLFVSIVMHCIYAKSDFPESHLDNKNGNAALSSAGVFHFWYMGIAVGILIQFYFHSKNVPHEEAKLVSWLLAFHIFLGTHIPLGIVNPKWYGRGVDKTAIMTFTAVCALLVYITHVMNTC